MGSPMINGIIRRAAFSRLLLSLILVGGILFLMYLALNVYYNLFSGPFTVTARDVIGINTLDGLQQYYIHITGDDMADTGIQRVSTNYGIETGHESFVALLLDDRYLLVQVPGDASEIREYTGSLVTIPSDVEREVINKLTLEYPELNGVFLPFMLDAGDFRLNGFLSLGAGVIGLLIGLWLLSGALTWMLDPSKHSMYRALNRFGEAQTVAEQIESELDEDHTTVGKTHLTRSWLVHRTGTSFSATRLADVVWLYHSVTQHRTNGIPTGKSFSALIWDKYGGCVTIPAKQKQVMATLDAIAPRVPWAIMGYKPEIENAWKKDRQGFLTAVEQRKQQTRAAY